ncbi:trifunctional hydroxymethylpyrimidine kinase/phosphomethylpyrimidine kinase/thiaminase [Rhizina undulata]
MAIPRVLTIAGSDSSGGAGIEADLKVITAHGCYGMTAITALTAQDTTGVHGIHPVPPEFVKKCIAACVDDVGVDVVKTGMLASAETISAVATTIRHYNIALTVIDPVMISTSGSTLLPPDAISTLIAELLPQTFLLTPNIPEAQLLLRSADIPVPEITSLESLIAAAKSLHSLGVKNVLLKGGHVPLKADKTVAIAKEEMKIVADVLYDGKEVTVMERSYFESKNTHGTGCSLASAIASNLAKGVPVMEAVDAACSYVHAGIETAYSLGKGNGPINHLHSTYCLPFARGHFVDYLLSHPKVRSAWKDYTTHEFVLRMGDGTLELEKFKFYIIQDYLFLLQFTRSSALAAYKCRNITDITTSTVAALGYQREMSLHLSYCSTFGISREEVESTHEAQACTAYTRYVLDIGFTHDFFSLQVAMAPCLLGYGEIATNLANDPKTKKEENIYWKWIENYVAQDYQQAVAAGRALLEKHAALQSPTKIEELVDIFAHATRMEKGFWNMGLGASESQGLNFPGGLSREA